MRAKSVRIKDRGKKKEERKTQTIRAKGEDESRGGVTKLFVVQVKELDQKEDNG